MNPMDLIMGQVEKAVRGHASRDTPGNEFDAEPLLGSLKSILGGGGGQQQQAPQGGINNAISSDNDPYGDPGLQGGAQNASQDPRQDPRFRNAKSSDEDPYGDPGLQ